MSISLEKIQATLDAKTKPPQSLGKLEEIALRLGYIQQTLTPRADRQRICVFAGSHGIAAEGVSAYPEAVTAQMVHNFLNGGAAINALCRAQGIELRVVDSGVDDGLSPLPDAAPHFKRRSGAAKGTVSFLARAAMSGEECAAAMTCGAEEVDAAVADGVEVMGIGEMGIGNTTSAAAVICGITGYAPAQLTGRGTGVDERVWKHKCEVVRAACVHHKENCRSGMDWLAAVGGFEIAAMVGAVLRAYEKRLPIVVDGFICGAAVVVAHAINPQVLEVCFFSHCSMEAGHPLVLSFLKQEAILDLRLRLGEGSGAALAMPLLKAAAYMIADMASFDSAGVSQKEP